MSLGCRDGSPSADHRRCYTGYNKMTQLTLQTRVVIEVTEAPCPIMGEERTSQGLHISEVKSDNQDPQPCPFFQLGLLRGILGAFAASGLSLPDGRSVSQEESQVSLPKATAPLSSELFSLHPVPMIHLTAECPWAGIALGLGASLPAIFLLLSQACSGLVQPLLLQPVSP